LVRLVAGANARRGDLTVSTQGKSFVKIRYLTVLAVLAMSVAGPLTASAHEGVPHNFEDLFHQLASRANVLTVSVDKVEQKQGNTCLKAMAMILKATRLAAEAKAAAKVAKSLIRAFPNEFEVATTRGLALQAVGINLYELLLTTYSNIVADVQAELDALQVEIDALPAGTGKDSAQAALNTAQQLLNNVGESTDFAAAAKILASSIKAALKTESAIAKALTSGGGGLSCQINDVSFQALGAAGTFVNATMQFALTGATAQRAVTISVFGVTGPGTYPIGAGSQVQEIGTGVTFASNLSGSVTITTVNLAQQKASGTFSFTATQTTPSPHPGNSVNVTGGTFNLSSVTVLPF
jgi:hypothetical protein